MQIVEAVPFTQKARKVGSLLSASQKSESISQTGGVCVRAGKIRIQSSASQTTSPSFGLPLLIQ